MKRILLSAFALAAMTSVAAAGPVPMTDAQMDAVTAGAVNQNNTSVIYQSNDCFACKNVWQSNYAEVKQTNINVDLKKGHHKFKKPRKKF